jgi:hypothetical protein
VSNKVYNFKIDEWVEYIPFPDNQDSEFCPAVILEVLKDDLFYDYKIFINDKGIKKVRQETVFPRG